MFIRYRCILFDRLLSSKFYLFNILFLLNKKKKNRKERNQIAKVKMILMVMHLNQKK